MRNLMRHNRSQLEPTLHCHLVPSIEIVLAKCNYSGILHTSRIKFWHKYLIKFREWIWCLEILSEVLDGTLSYLEHLIGVGL